MKTPTRRGTVLALPIAVMIVSLLVPVMIARHIQGSHTRGNVARASRGGALMDVGQSALAEAWWRLEHAAADASDPLFVTLREVAPAPRTLTVKVPHLTGALIGDPLWSGVGLVGEGVAATVAAPAPISTNAREGSLGVRLEVTVRHAPTGLVRTLRETRELKRTLLAVPVPFDRYSLAVLDATLAGKRAVCMRGDVRDLTAQEAYTEASAAQADELARAAGQLAPEAWMRRASFRFGGPGAGARMLAMLDRYQAEEKPLPVSGVIYLDNKDEPLRIAGRGFRGRLVIVATGDVELSDVRVHDRATDMLVVQAEGRLSAQGRIEAALIARGGVALSEDLAIRGALLVDRVRVGDRIAGRLESDVERMASRLDGRDRPEMFWLTFAPWATAREVEAP